MTDLSKLPTAFRRQVRKLGLNERTGVTSHALRLWCEENKDRYFIPRGCVRGGKSFVNPSLSPERNDSAA